MHTCQECQEIYSAWLDGEATPAEIEQMQRHTAECADCRQSTSKLGDLSRELRADESDYLRLATGALAELVLLEPAQSRLLPTPGQFLRSKILPTLAVGAWTAALLAAPALFRFWPLLALFVFVLTSRRSSRAMPFSLHNGWHQTIRPLGWAMLSGVLFPISALCYREGNGEWLDGVTGGAGICLAACAGALLGVVQVANPRAWKASRAGCWALIAGALGLSWSQSPLATALLLAFSAAAICLVVKRALYSTSLAGEALPFHYPAALVLLDLGALLLPALTYHVALDQIATYQFCSYFQLDRANMPMNGWGTLIPLVVCGWWVLVRNPLACCYELSQGTRTRYQLALIFGVATLTTPAALLTSGRGNLWQTVMVAVSGLVVGLILAYPARQPISNQRRGILHQRLTLWLLAAVAACEMGWLWQVHLPGESEPARALREAAERRPVPPGENGYDWVNFELHNGLDAELSYSDRVVSEPNRRGRLLGYLSQNLDHIDRCLSCPGFRAPNERLVTDQNAEKIGAALWLRAEADLARGDLNTGVTHLIAVAQWDQRISCNGRSADWWLPSREFSRRLRDDLSGVPLNADQIRRLWQALHASNDLSSALLHQVDLAYLRRHGPNPYRTQDPRILDLPTAIYDLKAARDAQEYLNDRRRAASLGWPTEHQVNYFNLCRAGLAVNLFLVEHGRPPANLAEAGAAYPKIEYQRSSQSLQVRWENQIEWNISTGGQHE